MIPPLSFLLPYLLSLFHFNPNQDLAELDFDYFRRVQLLAEKGRLSLPTSASRAKGAAASAASSSRWPSSSSSSGGGGSIGDSSGSDSKKVPSEHKWKANPGTARDQEVDCLRSCGYICHVNFPEEDSKR
jgi:hypothetical protein